MKIIIKNKIKYKLDEYKKETGRNKIWIAEQMGMSKQTMYKIMNATNLTLETLIKFAVALECKPEELYDYKVES